MLVFLPTRELVTDTYRLATIVKNFPGSSDLDGGNWNCCSVSLFARLGRDRIETMDGFARALAGNGWTLFKTRKDPIASSDPAVYLFRRSIEIYSFDGFNAHGSLFPRSNLLLVVNITLGTLEERMMLSGLHTVGDVFCCFCGQIVAWKYVLSRSAYIPLYKEVKFVLEKY